MGSKSKRLSDWKISLYVFEGCSGNLLFSNIFSSSLVENVIDSSNSLIRALDFSEENRLPKSNFS